MLSSCMKAAKSTVSMQLFVNQLSNIDFSYLHPQRGLVGETWWASAIVEGSLDEQGMICDFGTVKKALRHFLDEEIDHRLLVPVHHPDLSHTVDDNNRQITLNWTFGHKQLCMSAPLQAVTLIEAEQITADTVAGWCCQQLKRMFTGPEALHIHFVAEEIEGAFYHYSHGLKKHLGNCQRIAHGHRSRIEIYLDNQRQTSLEQEWSKRWQDIYLGSQEDIAQQNSTQIDFQYCAQQGDFHLSLPATACYLLPTDTTVEYIAEHLVRCIKQQHPHKQVMVKAFEGVNKGAIARR